ncbi:MAG: RimK/LysX family protein [Brasilonema octagenarum HA4186-MV1]|uniref:Uncharacterized protein n=2 Tax=Brasilonema TaxID=383614 RepID=A0A856MLV8_9CYAN|nr:RimK/LysX family protein [Brasilonema octagenarum HA4186-MV1]NMF61616.1 hypothetical protein [Brasilonema octagenarum UFV-OR1]QDL11084.1 hypothetical protein DP114_27160 [Brasilonema sennae CENA114]QDL17428.1 hypothetical protein DP113_27085 [Brasilonema octagenarum UFV-E1]
MYVRGECRFCTQHTVKRIFIFIFIGCLSVTGCTSQKTQATDGVEYKTQVVGWVEKARIPGVAQEIKVKLDTGAKTTSINAEILDKFKWMED